MMSNVRQNMEKVECTPELVVVKEEADDSICADDEVSLCIFKIIF